MPVKEVEENELDETESKRTVDGSTQTHTLYLEKRCPFCGRDVIDAIYRVATRDVKKLAQLRRQRLLDELAEKDESRTKRKGSIFRRGGKKESQKGKDGSLSLKNFVSCTYDASDSRQCGMNDTVSQSSRRTKTLSTTPSKKSRNDKEMSIPVLTKISKTAKTKQNSESKSDVKVKKEAQKMITTMFEDFVKQLKEKHTKPTKKHHKKNKKSRRKRSKETQSSVETSSSTGTDKEATSTESTTTASSATSSLSNSDENDENKPSGKEDRKGKVKISTMSIAAQTSLYYEDDGTPLSERESV